MKRLNNIWKSFLSLNNFKLAYRFAKKGRRYNSDIKKIESYKQDTETAEQFIKRREKRREKFLKHIIYRLKTGKYKMGAYRQKSIKDPKPRTIYVLRLYPDRIVQWALMLVLRDYLNKLFIYDSYACRKGKGQHKCVKRIKEFVRKSDYYAQFDISKFYPSIPHREMYGIISHKIKDKKILNLIKDIVFSIDGERNIPIGSLVSQWLGNLYLNEIDMYIKHKLKVKLYARYMDDFIIFDDDLINLKKNVKLIKNKVSEMRLSLSKCDVRKTSQGVKFIGFRVFSNYILLKKRTVKRMKKKLPKLPEKLKKHELTLIGYTSTIASAYGWCGAANAYNLRQSLGIDKMLNDARTKIKEVKMRGFPKYADIATKKDVENLIGIFPKETKTFLETLKGDRFIWQQVATPLSSGENGITDDTHRVVTAINSQTNIEERYQQEKIEDSNARVFRMGYSLQQISDLIESLS